MTSCVNVYMLVQSLPKNIRRKQKNIVDFEVKMSKIEDLEFPFCRDAMVVYEKLAKIGQGTFG